MTVSRRGLVAGASGLLLCGACSELRPGSSSDSSGSSGAGSGANVETEQSSGVIVRSSARLPRPYSVPLPIPPVLRPVRTTSTTDYYEITQKAARVSILPGSRTTIWGYNGRFPGPTIVSQRGRRTVVRHRNALSEPVVVHLHGGRTPASSDGYPTDLIRPGGSFAYDYPVDQPAATLWYHDHRMDFTGPQVYRGLAGFHLIRDPVESALPLPTGPRDIPLMIADRSFEADGSFSYPSLGGGRPGVRGDFISGVLGDCILVNGAPWPVLEVEAARYRFRILNASNARRYSLALDPAPDSGESFTQIGSDLGLLPAPVSHASFPLAPAERFDVVVDFSRYPVGTSVNLVNEYGSEGTASVMRFVVARRAADRTSIPSTLADVPALSPSSAVATRSFTFARGGESHHGMTPWTVNGEAFSTSHISATPRLGTVERWDIRVLNVAHPIHVHLAPFQVIDPGPYRGGWKDTVDLLSGDQVSLLLRFDGYRGKYVFHCHNLEHEDMAMMANFRVV